MKKLFQISAILFLLGIYSIASAQTTAPTVVANFKILVETTSDEIVLTCTEGCTFKQVRFRMNAFQPQAIDYTGMTTLQGNMAASSNPDYFHFTVEKTNEGLSFKGLKGTAWTDLSFSCKEMCRQFIDEGGMTEE